jgi:hypothetical protein
VFLFPADVEVSAPWGPVSQSSGFAASSQRIAVRRESRHIVAACAHDLLTNCSGVVTGLGANARVTLPISQMGDIKE